MLPMRQPCSYSAALSRESGGRESRLRELARTLKGERPGPRELKRRADPYRLLFVPLPIANIEGMHRFCTD